MTLRNEAQILRNKQRNEDNAHRDKLQELKKNKSVVESMVNVPMKDVKALAFDLSSDFDGVYYRLAIRDEEGNFFSKTAFVGFSWGSRFGHNVWSYYRSGHYDNKKPLKLEKIQKLLK